MEMSIGFVCTDEGARTRAGMISSAADMICIQYDTHLDDLRFQNQEFWISTTF